MRAGHQRLGRDAGRIARPFVMTSLKTLQGVSEVVAFIERKGMLAPA